MKANRIALILALILAAFLLSACGGTPPAATWPGLAVDQNAAYLTNGAIVYAVRLKDGEELWRFPEKANSKLLFYSNPVLTSDGQLLFGSSGTDHTLFRVDPETHTSTWMFTNAKDHWVASPLVDGDMLYAPNTDGTLYVFDLSMQGDDKLAWSVELGGKLWATPAKDDKYVYITSLDHHLYIVDLQTHEARTIMLDGAIPGSPVLAQGRLIVGSFGKSLKAINPADGSIVWNLSTESWVWGCPILDGDALYFGDLGGNFYAVNASDGTVIDKTKPDDAILAAPLALNGQIIFATESGSVYSLIPGAAPQSIEKLTGKLYTAPVTAGDLILVAPYQGDSLLVALDADGKIVWSFTPAK